MRDFKSIEEFNNYTKYLIELNTDDNVDELRQYLRISPERIAKKFDLDILTLVKKTNVNKKKIHKKLIIRERIKLLSKIIPETFNFNYSGVTYKSRMCVCVNFFEFKYKSKIIRFYPTIKYIYMYIKDQIVLLPTNSITIKIHITNREFNNYFIDSREDIINKILS
jgi:hypothetical protein